MRHSKIDLTMNRTPTRPEAVGRGRSIGTRCRLSLSGMEKQTAECVLSATGTDDSTPWPLVPVLVPTSDNPRVLQSIMGKIASAAERIGDDWGHRRKFLPRQTKQPAGKCCQRVAWSGR